MPKQRMAGYVPLKGAPAETLSLIHISEPTRQVR